MKPNRHNAVRKISAGERVRFHMDIKLVVEGEKTERDWIFPRALRGKKRSLSILRIHKIRNSARGFFSFQKLCALITDMSKHTSAATTKR